MNNDERGSGRTVRLAVAHLNNLLGNPGKSICTSDHHNTVQSNADMNTLVCKLLRELNVDYENVQGCITVIPLKTKRDHGIEAIRKILDCSTNKRVTATEIYDAVHAGKIAGVGQKSD